VVCSICQRANFSSFIFSLVALEMAIIKCGALFSGIKKSPFKNSLFFCSFNFCLKGKLNEKY